MPLFSGSGLVVKEAGLPRFTALLSLNRWRLFASRSWGIVKGTSSSSVLILTGNAESDVLSVITKGRGCGKPESSVAGADVGSELFDAGYVGEDTISNRRGAGVDELTRLSLWVPVVAVVDGEAERLAVDSSSAPICENVRFLPFPSSDSPAKPEPGMYGFGGPIVNGKGAVGLGNAEVEAGSVPVATAVETETFCFFVAGRCGSARSRLSLSACDAHWLLMSSTSEYKSPRSIKACPSDIVRTASARGVGCGQAGAGDKGAGWVGDKDEEASGSCERDKIELIRGCSCGCDPSATSGRRTWLSPPWSSKSMDTVFSDGGDAKRSAKERRGPRGCEGGSFVAVELEEVRLRSGAFSASGALWIVLNFSESKSILYRCPRA